MVRWRHHEAAQHQCKHHCTSCAQAELYSNTQLVVALVSTALQRLGVHLLVCNLFIASSVQVVGDSRCPIVDTWWQTETGSHLITPLPGATALKPGSATLPFFGVEPAVLNEKGEELEGEAEG